MIRLYQNSPLAAGQQISLDKQPSHHLIRVLRARKGVEVILFNGDGFEYTAELVDDNPKSCLLRINAQAHIENESPLKITLLQGISRSDRMNSCIQKSVELGVHAIIPVICQRTTTKLKGERAQKKLMHWQQIIISACEQSGRCVIPAIQPVLDFSKAARSATSADKLILDPFAQTSFNSLQQTSNEITLLIGPEGGFTDDEIQQASSQGFTTVSLGPRVLRTETAGPACIAIAQALWGDLG